ncbi:MAG: peroxiredoxin family protein [Gemmatimonadales bacterium]|nr:peroxiredoxin family protein [Gemmatimonadales bacterium]
MAAYRDRHDDFVQAGADVYALSVDPPERSARHKRTLHLPYELLCHPEREVVRAWDLYNRREHGGIARPAVFVLSPPDGRIRVRSVDRMSSRVPPERVLAALKALEGQALQRRVVIPKIGDLLASMLGR